MKPCFGKRKLLAWLALGELDPPQAQALRAHIQTCAPCRRYLQEISSVSKSLATQQAEPQIEASASFHRGVLRRLRAESSASRWDTSTARLAWRWAVPAMAAAAAVVLILSLLPRQPAVSPSVRVALPAAAPSAKPDLAPTIANYQQVALRSLDELEELLNRQAARPLPPAPVYTAAFLATASLPD